MRKLIVLALVGLAAQLVDGSLGMAYGVTSTTLLLTAGVVPATASQVVHLAEVGTTVVSGGAHWRFGNVDWRIVGRIAVPGAIGAFAGATVLSSLSTEAGTPWMAGILLALGVYILVRFTARPPVSRTSETPRRRFLAPLGVFAGFVDATGGGGWGPVTTSSLLATGRIQPRKVIGSVDTSEFLVSVAASIGFFIGLRGQGIPFGIVGALLAGGLVAAPVAAWLVRKIPAPMLGAAVGGLVILTNARTLLEEFEVTTDIRGPIYIAIALAWAAALAIAARAVLRQRTEAPETT